MMQINIGAHREQALNNLVFVHFGTEEPNATLIRGGCIQCYTQGETHLTTQRWSEKDDHI
jgi:hypothetical protein